MIYIIMINNPTKNMLIAFIIGSSWLAFFLWFVGFHSYVGKFNENNCLSQYGIDPYFAYTLAAPIYIGFMSCLAIIFSEYFQISTRTAFFVIGIISPTIVYMVIKYCNVYQFSDARYREQYLRLLGYHFILYNVVISGVYNVLKH